MGGPRAGQFRITAEGGLKDGHHPSCCSRSHTAVLDFPAVRANTARRLRAPRIWRGSAWSPSRLVKWLFAGHRGYHRLRATAGCSRRGHFDAGWRSWPWTAPSAPSAYIVLRPLQPDSTLLLAADQARGCPSRLLRFCLLVWRRWAGWAGLLCVATGAAPQRLTSRGGDVPQPGTGNGKDVVDQNLRPRRSLLPYRLRV